MAPIRRYLRISKYSVLECRIYLENPGLADTWLLGPRNPVLPRIFESVRPLVLPKLREENERAKGKGKKASRGIKDVVVQDVSSRHSLLTKQKFFDESGGTAPASRSGLPPGTNDSVAVTPVIMRENSDVDAIDLESIPAAPDLQRPEARSDNTREVSRRGYARHNGKRGFGDLDPDDAAAECSSESDVRPKRKRSNAEPAVASGSVADTGDDKKLSLRTSYDGFSIYGRILCLVVKRRSNAMARGGSAIASAGQAMMEDWIASTQIQQEDDAS